MQFDMPAHRIIGPAGELPVLPDDLVVSRLAMLIEGQCEGLGAAKAAEKLGLSKQRYFQLLKLYREHGSAGLQGHKPGPKHNYVRTDEVERQVIRHRFLDPDASVDIIAQKLRQAGFPISTGAWTASSRSTAFKKKLYRYRPGSEPTIEVRTNRNRTKPVPCDPRSIEHGVRQFLADKVMGNLAGIWLLVPELLRLGAWDLVCGWTGQSPERVGPRLALQLIHEAALCRTGLRHRRTLNQRIFELANGLPFLASDMAVHELLAARTVADSLRFQVALGKVRRASGHFRGRLLAIDPHRVRSFSKRHMRLHRHDDRERPTKTAQTFFALDVETGQPICFTTGTSARTAAAAAEELLKLASDILNPQAGQALVLADSEHFTTELLDRVKTETNFDLLVPMPNRRSLRAQAEGVAAGSVPDRGGRATQPRSWHIPLRTARLGRSTNTSSGKGSGRRNTASMHFSRPAMATRLRSWPAIFPNAGTWRSSSMLIRHWVGTEQGRAISTFAMAR